MFSLIPSDANDPQGLMRRKEPNKQTNKQTNLGFLLSNEFAFISTLIPRQENFGKLMFCVSFCSLWVVFDCGISVPYSLAYNYLNSTRTRSVTVQL